MLAEEHITHLKVAESHGNVLTSVNKSSSLCINIDELPSHSFQSWQVCLCVCLSLSLCVCLLSWCDASFSSPTRNEHHIAKLRPFLLSCVQDAETGGGGPPEGSGLPSHDHLQGRGNGDYHQVRHTHTGTPTHAHTDTYPYPHRHTHPRPH